MIEIGVLASENQH